jgi:hypothetical protein
MMQQMKHIHWFALVLLFLGGCTKVEYTKIDQPAYLRVFNNFNYGFSMDDKDKKVPFLCMLINPTFDKDGKVTGAEIVGDFLDVRDPYAPPYPSHIGSSTSVNNPEYPGKENVLVAPVVNGYDLSSWAQIPSGTQRFLFLYRPKNNIPYFNLEDHLKNDVLLDTTLTLSHQEVYTMQLLQKDYITRESGVLLRKEIFYKQPFSDSLVYVNFYNYSANGFLQTSDEQKPEIARMGHFQTGIKDRMDIYLTLYPDQEYALTNMNYKNTAIPGYKGKYFTTLERNNLSDAAAPYHSFPLFANPSDNGISTKCWQSFDFFVPGMNPSNNIYGINDRDTDGNWAALNCQNNGSTGPARSMGAYQPNMLVNIHSGKFNPRSFATVNSVEVVNGSVYLMTIQRKYPAPEY